MAEKLDKLNELGELLKSGAISEEEFNNLKREILESSEKIKPKNNINVQNQNNDKERIILKSFWDDNNKKVNAPNIEYLNFKNISESDTKLLKPFIRLKQIHAPSEMTNDEIKIGNKLFSHSEIYQMNSERGGFNYPFASIFSVIAAGAALYFITISPCFIILGAGSGLIAALWMSITNLNAADATKLDRTFSYIALVLGVIAIFVYFTWDSSSSSNEGINSIDCSNSQSSYEQGYASGKTARLLGDYSSCSSYVDSYNYQTGRNILSASDCFCDGYDDGIDGNSSKY